MYSERRVSGGSRVRDCFDLLQVHLIGGVGRLELIERVVAILCLRGKCRLMS